MADDIVIIHKGEIRMTGELNMILREGESLEAVFFSLTEGGA